MFECSYLHCVCTADVPSCVIVRNKQVGRTKRRNKGACIQVLV